jgi:hypothetical protein
LLPDPGEVGVDSDAWPGVVRKTDLEIYRWLANTDYKHLAEVVGQLEGASAAGCTFGGLLTTKGREQFASHTSELVVADALLNRGYLVNTIDRSGEKVRTSALKARGSTWPWRSTAGERCSRSMPGETT